MADVFISYSRKDTEFVRRLHQAFAALDYDICVDREDILLTAKWMNEIKLGIEAAHTFVFIISPDSARSKVCFDEVEHAYADADSVPGTAVVDAITDAHAIDYADSHGHRQPVSLGDEFDGVDRRRAGRRRDRPAAGFRSTHDRLCSGGVWLVHKSDPTRRAVIWWLADQVWYDGCTGRHRPRRPFLSECA